MTKVYARKQPQTGKYELSVLGHATGRPDVCAAVSMLVCALAEYVEERPQPHSVQVRDGEARLSWQGDVRAEAVFDLTVLGLKQLAQEYPMQVQMVQERKEGKGL